MRFDADRVLQNVRATDTEDLLDRVTVYRAGMEPEAVDLIEMELRRRGVRGHDIEIHAEKRRGETKPLPDGTVARCSFCHRPATAESWGWQRLWGLLPVFPRYHHYCDEHIPRDLARDADDEAPGGERG